MLVVVPLMLLRYTLFFFWSTIRKSSRAVVLSHSYYYYAISCALKMDCWLTFFLSIFSLKSIDFYEFFLYLCCMQNFYTVQFLCSPKMRNLILQELDFSFSLAPSMAHNCEFNLFGSSIIRLKTLMGAPPFWSPARLIRVGPESRNPDHIIVPA